MKRGLWCFFLLLFAGCSAEKEPEAITVSTNDPVEVSKILKEDQTENAQENYVNRTYVKEHSVTFDPQRPLSQLLIDYSWYNDSYILTFKPNQQIIASQFHGSKTKLYDKIYGTYELLNESTLMIHVDGNLNPKIISDYTYTVLKKDIELQLKDTASDHPTHSTLRAVEKLNTLI